MQDALKGLKVGTIPSPAELGTFGDIQAAVGFAVRVCLRGFYKNTLSRELKPACCSCLPAASS